MTGPIYRQIADKFVADATSFAEHKVFADALEAVKDVGFMQQSLNDVRMHHLLRSTVPGITRGAEYRNRETRPA